MKVVLDTNVLISGLLFSGFSAKVFDYCIYHCNVYSSQWILNELEDKFRGKFKLEELQIQGILSMFQEKFTVVLPNNLLPDICRDLDDNNILQLADCITADYIITGDKDLLVLQTYQGAKIVSPREFYNLHIVG